MKFRSSEFMGANKALYEWYLIACSKNIYPGGPELTEKGKEIAERLGKSNFKGSRGWLEKWKAWFNIKQVRVCGESGDVRGDNRFVERKTPWIGWRLRKGWYKKCIWNMDETGVFGRLYQIVDSEAKEGNARDAKRANKGWRLLSSLLLLARRKNRPLYVVCVDSTNLFCKSIISARAKHWRLAKLWKKCFQSWIADYQVAASPLSSWWTMQAATPIR